MALASNSTRLGLHICPLHTRHLTLRMTYAQLDRIADAVIPLLALTVIVGAIWLQRAAAWKFLLRAVVATLLVQQSAKFVQKLGPLGHDFPSTHFAVALCLATLLTLLNRKLVLPSVSIIVAYGALMLWQHYHTPLEMLGALYAIPVAWFVGSFPRSRSTTTQSEQGLAPPLASPHEPRA